MYKNNKKCQNKGCNNILLGSPAIINKKRVCRNCWLKIKYHQKIDRMTKKCIVNHKNNKNSATPPKQAKKHYPTKRWMIITEDGKIIDKFRIKQTAISSLPRLKDIYLEGLEVRRIENQSF